MQANRRPASPPDPGRQFTCAACAPPLLSAPVAHLAVKRTMKMILTFVLLSFVLTGCGQRDATIQRQLTGTWTRHFGNGCSVTNVIAPDGSYHCQLVGGPNGPTNTLEGTLIAKNGVLIDTVTKDSETNQQTPRVTQEQIVRIDGHQFVVSINNGATTATLDKVDR